jgi:hypothetical protein
LAGVGRTIDADEPKVNVGGAAELPGGFIFKKADPLWYPVDVPPNPLSEVPAAAGSLVPKRLPPKEELAPKLAT